ncbi:biotin--protein ligase 1, chloroplastic-like [Arachis duranensis]|uniref:Biotin--protein ligase 1, chloroplastic-like n=1 Tax=Arachis duranensis TaxID=130453 RepID=A0A6P4CRV4_ARADU|nr:biotin--protein ligase 1, chloroplastic-like [Arachis duranensis]
MNLQSSLSFINVESLCTDTFGRLLVWSPRLASTHDVVLHNFCELSIGSVCLADIQTKGRGRSKNVWESPLGCFLFFFTLQMEDGRIVPLVQYVVSLAITKAVKDICNKNGLPSIDVKIKWPNDLYLNGLKVGGILCTSTYKLKKFNVSAGSKTFLPQNKRIEIDVAEYDTIKYWKQRALGLEKLLEASIQREQILQDKLLERINNIER